MQLRLPPQAVINTTTPKRVTPKIRALAKKLVPNSEFIFVNVSPLEFCIPNECHKNVKEQVSQSGGTQVFGWTIWEWPYVLIEAEFHSVWQDQSHTLHDITPKPDQESQILFIPDASRTWNFDYRNRIHNVRMPVRKHPFIEKYLEETAKIDTLKDKYLPPGKEVTLPLNHPLMKADAKLFELAKAIGYLKDPDLSPKSACYCGSGKKYGRCCAR